MTKKDTLARGGGELCASFRSHEISLEYSSENIEFHTLAPTDDNDETVAR